MRDLSDRPLLVEMLEAGRQSWPGLQISAQAFDEHLQSVLPPDADVESTLSLRVAGDLYLACACARGDERALSLFSKTYRPLVAGYVAKVTRVQSEVDEIFGRLIEKLFVVGDSGQAPKILAYRGRGPLGAWLRVVALREALDLKRRVRSTASVEIDEEIRSPVLDPEMAHLKDRYRREFRQAFEATLASLPDDQRTLLRFHYLDGLNIDEIGVAFQVHRSTAARRIAQAREAILEETRRRLQESCGLEGQDLDSLLGLVRSQMDASIVRLLQP